MVERVPKCALLRCFQRADGCQALHGDANTIGQVVLLLKNMGRFFIAEKKQSNVD